MQQETIGVLRLLKALLFQKTLPLTLCQSHSLQVTDDAIKICLIVVGFFFTS